jgi:Leucine-rich repeat (LRR) protein
MAHDLANETKKAGQNVEAFQTKQTGVITLRDKGLESLPAGISHFASLSSADLAGNSFKRFPSQIQASTALKSLFMARNLLVELSPCHIGRLAALETLDLRFSRVSAASFLFHCFSLLPRHKTLSLMRCYLCAVYPPYSPVSTS